MTNFESLSAKCTRICSAFYPDAVVLEDALNDAGLDPTKKAKSKDPAIIKQAIILVKGFVETNRSEGGVSTGIDREAVNRNILFWCKQCGLDASEFVDGLKVIKNGSNRW